MGDRVTHQESSTGSTRTNRAEHAETRTDVPRRWHTRGPVGAATCCVLLSAGVLAACGASSGQSITLYSGQHVQTTDALVAAFERATGITVNVRPGDEDDLANQIVVEGNHSPADVVFTENSPALEYLQEKGLLSQLDASTLADTPSRYDSPKGDWVGVSARVSVLVYNPSLISESQLPTTVLELADPKFRGELAFAPSETDFQPIVTSVVKTYGKAEALSWLQGIKSNAGSHIYPDNETIANDVNRGAVAFGVVNQYYWYRMRARDRRVRHALGHHLLRPARPRVRARRVGCRNIEIEQEPVGIAALRGLLGVEPGPADHLSLDQLRVHDRLRRDHQPA